jgi:hypothetical protein
MCPDRRAFGAEFSAKRGVHPRGGKIDVDDGQESQEAFDEGFARARRQVCRGRRRVSTPADANVQFAGSEDPAYT